MGPGFNLGGTPAPPFLLISDWGLKGSGPSMTLFEIKNPQSKIGRQQPHIVKAP